MDKQSFIFSEKKDGQIFKVIDKSKSYDCKEVTLKNYKNVQNNIFKEYLILNGLDNEKIYRVIEFISNEDEIIEQIKFVENKSQFNSLWYKSLTVEKKSIDECSSKNRILFLAPLDQFNFKSTIEKNNNVQQDLYLKAFFHLILGAYDIGENAPKNDSMFLSFLNYSFDNLYLISSTSNNNVDFKLTYPFINEHPQSNIKSVPFFKSFLNYIDFQFSDTLLNDIIIKMNNQSISKNHFLFVIKKIIKIIFKEKDRLLDKYPNSNLDQYFEQFEASILFDEEKTIKMNISNKIDPFKTIQFSSFFKTYKSESGLLYLVNIKGKDYGVEIYRENQINLFEIETIGKNLHSVIDNNHFKYFNHCRDEDKKIVYLIYELPSTFCFGKFDNGLSNGDLNKCEKDKLFYRLIEKHISNYDFIQNNAKKVVRILNSLNNYSLNLIISNEEQLFYSYSYNMKANNNFIDSIYDIGKWVYGKKCEEINQLQCLQLLQHLVKYNNIQLIHHQIRFSFSNIYNLIRKNLSGFKKIIPKIEIKYPVIKIEEKEYYISNLSSPFENHNDFYKTIILTLKNTDTGDKLICCRNQNNNKLFGNSSSQLNLLSGDFIPSPNILSAICTVKDSNTTFTFFKYHQVIPLNRFLLASLLLYLEYLRSNNQHNCNNEMVLINLSIPLDFECDSYLLFDIREFAEKYFNVYYGWEQSALNSLSLISQYIYFNDETIKEDKLALDLYKLIYN
ncbi:hypothetical protein ACTFIU_000517 [Dictyostelium citrinum]